MKPKIEIELMKRNSLTLEVHEAIQNTMKELKKDIDETAKLNTSNYGKYLYPVIAVRKLDKIIEKAFGKVE